MRVLLLLCLLVPLGVSCRYMRRHKQPYMRRHKQGGPSPQKTQEIVEMLQNMPLDVDAESTEPLPAYLMPIIAPYAEQAAKEVAMKTLQSGPNAWVAENPEVKAAVNAAIEKAIAQQFRTS
ncbi:uncharacterized protein LOC133531195 [Cydia pomonella]|uniref:uncharacterized protein LOC133531195 n=1 Tax=Cydia pomonella TaxID=82600 RepID=UPI002ADE036D|nr:uncharacterized protein LOC133531195 [Cydia pomonella]